MGLCCANPPLSRLAKVLTKFALEGARVVLGTYDWGTAGEQAYWRRLLYRMMVAERNSPTALSTLLKTVRRLCLPLNGAVCCPSLMAL